MVEIAKVRDLDAAKRKVEIEYEAVSTILEVRNFVRDYFRK